MVQALPAEMTAIDVPKPGPVEALRVARRPVPKPGSGEVLLKVAAAGLNRADVLQREGNYPMPPGVTDVLGLEASGTVVAVGAGVTDWRVGDETCALLAGGGYAEYCAVPGPQCLRIPKGVGLVDAAALPEVMFTVWDNVFTRCRLKAGESFLVHGGSSGIGTAAIQLAKAFGARAFATAGSDAKCKACVTLGAERAINYRTEDFVAVIKDATGGRGVDVILDMVGGDYFPRNIQSLALDGRLIHIATDRGDVVELNIPRIMVKRLMIGGSTLRARSIEQKGVIAKELLEKVWPLIDSGRIKPVVHAMFALEQAAEAHRLMESSAHIGKILLVPGGPRRV
ncbi:MAG: NAD(P)H-quinone oxidoreductase [Alphaproteobacteria bacterium]